MLTALLVVAAAVLGVNLFREGDTTTAEGGPPATVPVPGSEAPPAPADGDQATVVEVVDGDTLVVTIGTTEEQLRLIGIDTPESVSPNTPDECYGQEASQRLAELVPPGTPVRLERDVEPRDRYDRLLVYVYRVSDGLFVNLDQVANGFAEAKEYPPNIAKAGELESAESAARSAGHGLWTACGGTDVPAPG